MNWNEILTIVLGSSLLSVLFDRLIQLRQEGYNRHKEEQRNLYAELALLVNLAIAANKTTKEAFEDIKTHGQSLKKDSMGGSNAIQEDINNQMLELNKLLVPYWWDLVDKIKNTLENKAGYIRDKDHEVIVYFFEAYLKRRLIGKDDASKFYFFSEDKCLEYQDTIYKAINKLSEICKE